MCKCCVAAFRLELYIPASNVKMGPKPSLLGSRLKLLQYCAAMMPAAFSAYGRKVLQYFLYYTITPVLT